MTPVDTFVERVLESGVLSKSLVHLPPPATQADIEGAESRLHSHLPEALKVLLRRWNGANLDVVRFVCCDQLELQAEGLYFANDPAGFMYFLDASGAVHMLDTDGGGDKPVALDVADFLEGYVFGPRACDFGGAEWAAELGAAGLAT